MKPYFLEEDPLNIALQFVQNTKIVEQLHVEASQNPRVSFGATPIAVIIGSFDCLNKFLRLRNLNALWSISELRGIDRVETTYYNKFVGQGTINSLLGFILPGEPKNNYIEKAEDVSARKRQRSRREILIEQQSRRVDLNEQTYLDAAFDNPFYSWIPHRNFHSLIAQRLFHIYTQIQSVPNLGLNLEIDPFVLIAGGNSFRGNAFPIGRFPRSIEVNLDPGVTRGLKEVVKIDKDEMAILRARESWLYKNGHMLYLRPRPNQLKKLFSCFRDPQLDISALMHETDLRQSNYANPIENWINALSQTDLSAALLSLGHNKIVTGGLSNFETSHNLRYCGVEKNVHEPNYGFLTS